MTSNSSDLPFDPNNFLSSKQKKQMKLRNTSFKPVPFVPKEISFEGAKLKSMIQLTMSDLKSLRKKKDFAKMHQKFLEENFNIFKYDVLGAQSLKLCISLESFKNAQHKFQALDDGYLYVANLERQIDALQYLLTDLKVEQKDLI